MAFGRVLGGVILVLAALRCGLLGVLLLGAGAVSGATTYFAQQQAAAQAVGMDAYGPATALLAAGIGGLVAAFVLSLASLRWLRRRSGPGLLVLAGVAALGGEAIDIAVFGLEDYAFWFWRNVPGSAAAAMAFLLALATRRPHPRRMLP